ncbi:MAG: PadR family transcriptional regulator [Chloroflexi bacterium]|nr:MAG: PadR family transcriptional regulator [Chloroflexota bacterium]
MPRSPDASPQTLLVLAALLEAPDAWHYGYDLSRRLGLRSGTLYPILVRLAERGCLETRWVEAERPGRPPRHTYRLTADGRALARSRLAAAEPARARPSREVSGG